MGVGVSPPPLPRDAMPKTRLTKKKRTPRKMSSKPPAVTLSLGDALGSRMIFRQSRICFVSHSNQGRFEAAPNPFGKKRPITKRTMPIPTREMAMIPNT